MKYHLIFSRLYKNNFSTSTVKFEKTLYVKGLSPGFHKNDLTLLFISYGMTEKARVIKNGGTARGYGFITVLDDILAEKAVLDLNGTTIPGGNIITVEISHTPPKNSKKNKLKGINEEKENLTLLINGQKND